MCLLYIVSVYLSCFLYLFIIYVYLLFIFGQYFVVYYIILPSSPQPLFRLIIKINNEVGRMHHHADSNQLSFRLGENLNTRE